MLEERVRIAGSYTRRETTEGRKGKEGGEVRQTWRVGVGGVLNGALTAEYMMNLRGLPSSVAMEKLDRMAFSRSPGELAHWWLWCE